MVEAMATLNVASVSPLANVTFSGTVQYSGTVTFSMGTVSSPLPLLRCNVMVNSVAVLPNT